MTTMNYNQQHEQPIQIMSMQQQQLNFNNSLESNNSVNGISFLTAANTIMFNSSSPALAQSPVYSMNSPNFASSLMQLKQQQQTTVEQDDLDFDLHYASNANNNNSNVEQEDEEDVHKNDSVLSEQIFSIEDINNNSISANNKNSFGYIPTDLTSALNDDENSGTQPKNINFKRQLNNPLTTNSPNFFNNDMIVGSAVTPSQLTKRNSLTSNPSDSTPQNSVSKFSTSRTYMKMQLMKQQVEQYDRKRGISINSPASLSNLSNMIHTPNDNTQQNDHNQKAQSLQLESTRLFGLFSPPSSSPIKSSTLTEKLLTSEIISRDVLAEEYQSETKLQNPTKYHVMQIAKQLQHSAKSVQQQQQQQQQQIQVQPMSVDMTFDEDQLNNNNKFNSDAHLTHREHDASCDGIEILNTDFSSSFASDFFQHSVESNNPESVGSSISQSDVALFNELDSIPEKLNELDILSGASSTCLTSSEIEKEINQLEQYLNQPKTLPADAYLNGISPMSPTGRPSSSCPSEVIRLKRMQGVGLSSAEVKYIIKDRQKKDTHNMIERKRRYNINDKIKELGTILPKSTQIDMKPNKGSILRASVHYIKHLQLELAKAKRQDTQYQQTTIMNAQLIQRIKDLESKVQNVQLTPNSSIENNPEMTSSISKTNNKEQQEQDELMKILNNESLSDEYSFFEEEQQQLQLQV